MQKCTYWVEGTTCRSCEIAIERAWKNVPGVRKVTVNGATGEAALVVEGETPGVKKLQEALTGTHYTVHEAAGISEKRPSWKEVLGLFALVVAIGYIASQLGLFRSHITFSAGLSFGAVFVIGLVAASSSCIAVVGGLLLSSAARFNKRYGSLGTTARLRPVAFFIAGRIIGYTVLGGLLGVVGSVLTPSPLLTALIATASACYMIIMGLDMLRIAPRFLKRLMPGMSKNLSHSILGSSKEHWGMPFVLGTATFFLPCGFTQALQLYALTTHSFWTSAELLLAFSLGTAPALCALGYASGSLKGKLGQWFFKFSGALVIVLGLWNINNAFAIAGFTPVAQTNKANASDSSTVTDGVQVVRMNVGFTGYSPNRFTVKIGIPVRWEIQGSNSMGCASVLVSRNLGLQKFLSPGLNVVEFTPRYSGEIAFSCSMGMYRGSFTVVN